MAIRIVRVITKIINCCCESPQAGRVPKGEFVNRARAIGVTGRAVRLGFSGFRV